MLPIREAQPFHEVGVSAEGQSNTKHTGKLGCEK
jgi:hypothetical protein